MGARDRLPVVTVLGASPSPITSVCDLEQERRPPAQVPRPSSPACRCAAPNNSLSLSEPQLPPPKLEGTSLPHKVVRLL